MRSLAVAVCAKLLTVPEIATEGPEKRKAPAGGWGLEGLGLLICETKTHPVTAGIMIAQRMGSVLYELNWIACIPLLLQLFGKQVADCPVGLALRSPVPLNILASDETVHVGLLHKSSLACKTVLPIVTTFKLRRYGAADWIDCF
jgi:hypothetical protein